MKNFAFKDDMENMHISYTDLWKFIKLYKLLSHDQFSILKKSIGFLLTKLEK